MWNRFYLEDSIELIKDLLGKFENWYEEESIYYNELIEECCEREELDKVESFNGQMTALNGFFQEQIHLIRMHCHQINGQTEEQPEEELHETSNNTFLPQSNVASDYEAESHSTTGSTDNDGGVEAPELNDDPFLSRSDIESNSSNDLTRSEPEEPPETEDNTSLSRPDVGIHVDEETVKSNETDLGMSEEQFISKMCETLDEDDVEADSPNSRTEDDDMTYMLSLISDIEQRMEELRNSFDDDETDADSQNDLTGSEAEDECFQAVGNSSPIDPEPHDIETAGTSHKNGRDSSHSIETNRRLSGGQNGQLVKIIENGKDLTGSDQVIDYLETAESNKTVPDTLEEQTMGIEFGPDRNIHLFKCDGKGRNDRNYETNLTNGRHNKSELKAPEAVEEPYPPPSDLVSPDKVTEDVSEVKTIDEDRSAESVGQSSGIIPRFKPQEIKRVKPKVKYRNHRQYETDQILTNKSEDNAVWMLEVFKRYFRQHLFKSSKPPLVLWSVLTATLINLSILVTTVLHNNYYLIGKIMKSRRNLLRWNKAAQPIDDDPLTLKDMELIEKVVSIRKRRA